MEVPLFSATQISLWTECKRKWGFRYLEGLKPDKSPGQLLGTEVQDEQLDPWLLTGRPFDFSKPSGEIALALSMLLPPPRTPGVQLRRKFVLPSPTGKWGYQGELDLYAPDSSIVPGLIVEPGVHLVSDIKTTKNLDYAKTEETLKTDPQAILYDMVIMFEEGADFVDNVWFTGRTRKPYRAQYAHLRVHAPHVVEQFERIESIASELAGTRSANPKVEELPPNPRMCHQYGGCPHRHICNLSPEVHASAVNLEAKAVSNETNKLLASLRKRVAGPAATVPGPYGLTVPAPGPHHVGPGNPHPAVAAGAAELAAAQKEFEVKEPTEMPPWLASKTDPRHENKPAPPAINPPESALPPAPPVGVAALAEPAKPKRGRPAKSESSSMSNTDVAVIASDVVAVLRRDLVAALRAAADRLESG